MGTDKIADTGVSLFREDEKVAGEEVTIHFEGQAIRVPANVSVAAALLMAGVRKFRYTPASGIPRAAYCMMGVCFECLVEIDGKPSRQSCLTQVCEGMEIKRQQGASELNLSIGGEGNGA